MLQVMPRLIVARLSSGCAWIKHQSGYTSCGRLPGKTWTFTGCPHIRGRRRRSCVRQLVSSEAVAVWSRPPRPTSELSAMAAVAAAGRLLLGVRLLQDLLEAERRERVALALVELGLELDPDGGRGPGSNGAAIWTAGGECNHEYQRTYGTGKPFASWSFVGYFGTQMTSLSFHNVIFY